MTLRQRFSALLVLASLTLVGCYLPEGTKKITGGTGKSLTAGSGLASGEGGETVISATVSLTLGDQLKGEGARLATGKVDLVDQGRNVHVNSDIEVSFYQDAPIEDFPVLGLSYFGKCTYQVKGGKPQPGFVYGFLAAVESESGEKPLKLLVMSVFDTNDDFVYGANAIFDHGSFVFHNKNGQPVK
ncbi:MAG: hypothetical protein ACK6D3_00120 [Planctomycetaceae bacterium]|jgi:hypothetical protein